MVGLNESLIYYAPLLTKSSRKNENEFSQEFEKATFNNAKFFKILSGQIITQGFQNSQVPIFLFEEVEIKGCEESSIHKNSTLSCHSFFT